MDDEFQSTSTAAELTLLLCVPRKMLVRFYIMVVLSTFAPRVLWDYISMSGDKLDAMNVQTAVKRKTDIC